MTMADWLPRVDWTAAAARAEARDPLLAAGLRSLAALFADGFDAGVPLLRRARDAEPLNPLHALRTALFHARFGDLVAANDILQRLQGYELQAPVIAYLRGLFLLRGGRADQARAIAGTIETRHPDFVLAKFLRAEAQVVMAANAGRLERHLRGLPNGEAWEACWADLLVKLVLLHPNDGPGLAARFDKRVSAGSALRGALDTATTWAGASAEALGEALQAEAPGSRSEALLLECLVDKLTKPTADAEADAPPDKAIRLLAALRARYPERAALSQVLHAFNTHRASAVAADGRFEEALRFTERSLTELPYDLVYYQNRAALFTLLREPTAYHDAWQALNTHQYRLLLLGFAGAVLEQTIKTHRVFAEQSRGGTDRLSKGLFRVVLPEQGESYLRLNDDAIAADPDLLRQWFHHKRAELVLRHLSLGDDPSAMLLGPEDRDDALARAAALGHLGQSLPVLAAEEGEALVEALGARWLAAAHTMRTRYGRATPARPASDKPAASDKPEAPEGEPETQEDADAETEPEALADLREEHLAVLADLCLVVWMWQPRHEHMWIAEELLAWLPHQLAFVDIKTLARAQVRQSRGFPYPLRFLAAEVREAGGGGEGALADFSDDDLKAVTNRAAVEILQSMAYAAYYGSPGLNRERAMAAMDYIRRARALRPAEAWTELIAAELLSLGEYFDEARRSLDRFRRLVSANSERAMERAKRVEDALDEHRRKGEVGHGYTPSAESDMSEAGDLRRVEELLSEIDASPTSWRLYAALVKELVLVGRMDEAVEWADRCVSRCLGRSEQINARGLAMEMRGLSALASDNPRAAKLYAVGAFEPARRALEALAAAGATFDVPLHYLLGRCQLETGATDAASTSFKTAFDQSGQSIYRPVLRSLTEDIDQAYLVVARSAVEASIKEGDFDQAIAESCRVLSRLKKPEAWLVDIARMFCSVAMGRPQGERSGFTMPDIQLAVPWRERLTAALGSGDDVDRAIAIAELARATDEAAAPRAAAVIERAGALRRQLEARAALERIGHLLADRKFEETLAAIGNLDPEIAEEPRLRRLRVLALLGLHRFQEADDAVANFGEALSADVREFLASYPAFAFRQRIALAHKMLRDGKAREALALIESLNAPSAKEEADLAYCRAFGAALEGYTLRKRGDKGAAHRRFEEALALLDPHVRQPAAPAHLKELYERLDTEAEQHVG